MHIGRCIGALNIGEAVTSLQAPGFLHLQDKKALFVTRIVVLDNYIVFDATYASSQSSFALCCYLHLLPVVPAVHISFSRYHL